MSESTDDDLDAVQDSREAALALSILRPLVSKQIKNITTLLISEYRSGGATLESLIGRTAEMSALTALLENLEVTFRQGERAMERLHAPER